MTETRLFVGNVPPNVSEEELQAEFGYYGVVNRIELKNKEDKVFAFVNLETSDKLVDQCIQEFGRQKFKGNFLNVSRAKESFLERLKREREESEGKKQVTEDSKDEASFYLPSKIELPKIESKNDEEISSSSEEEEEEPVVPVLPKKPTNGYQKPLSEKPRSSYTYEYQEVKSDDVKRREGLKKIRDLHDEKQRMIQAALTAIDSTPRNKIIFEAPEIREDPRKDKKQLFDEEDYEDDENYEITEKYSGENGEKLFELQSRFQNDDRFKVDQRFLEQDSSKKKLSKRELEIQEKERKKMRKQLENWDRDGQDEIEEEKEKQLSILDAITGVPRASRNNLSSIPQKTMLRYDPSKKEHLKYLEVPKVNVEENLEDSDHEMQEEHEENPYEVSENKFYQVSSNLKDTIQQKSDSKPFSIFDMLGISHKDEPDQEYKEKEIQKKKKFDLNEVKFKYDSSETDEEAEETKMKKKKVKSQNPKKGGKFSKSGVWRQNFFVADGDERLKGESLFSLKSDLSSSGN